MVMNSKSCGCSSVTFAVLIVLGLALAGCATEAAQKRQEIERKVANARTQSDHEALAAWFEQQAREAGERAENHRRMREHYERWAFIQPYRPRGYGFPDLGGSAGFVQRCDSLVRLDEQAAEENLALAKLHRQAAAGADPR
jgi:hypothetical protein